MRVNEIRVVFDSDNIEKTRDEIAAVFYEFGATGLKIDEPLENLNPLDYYKNAQEFYEIDNAVSAYFPENFYSAKRNEAIRAKIDEIFGEREDVIYSIEIHSFEEEDYSNSWKNYLYPEKVSEKFVIKPTWREYEPEEGEHVIELDPGRAFGTGSHPTTSICMKLMEEENMSGLSVLDVGTGSGILMVAAALLGAERVVGVDIDELAVEVAEENLLLNNIPAESFEVHKGDLINTLGDEKFDIVVANILADVLLILMQDISKVVKKGGKIILSGIVDEKEHLVVQEIKRLGYEILEVRADREWRGIIVQA